MIFKAMSSAQVSRYLLFVYDFEEEGDIYVDLKYIVYSGLIVKKSNTFNNLIYLFANIEPKINIIISNLYLSHINAYISYTSKILINSKYLSSITYRSCKPIFITPNKEMVISELVDY
jgi:hypothetical protein